MKNSAIFLHFYAEISYKSGYVPIPSDPEERYLHLPNRFRLSVVGLNLTPDLERGLEDFGLQSFLPTPLGFQARVIRRRVG